MDAFRDVELQREVQALLLPDQPAQERADPRGDRPLPATLPPIRLLLFSGGEPFLRRDLPEIIRAYSRALRFLHRLDADERLLGRAHLRDDRAHLRDLAGLALGIAVSLDGMRTFTTGCGKCRASGTTRSHAAGDRRADAPLPAPDVGVNTVFMRENQRDIEPLLNYIHDEVRPPRSTR